LEAGTTQAPRRNFVNGRHTDPRERADGTSPMKFAQMPRGGFKHSGYGKNLSVYGFADYTRVKHVMSYIGGRPNEQKAKRPK
jgi:acyl-CoA reductase-like NAD-dependent aldehyde dehydrogenase